MNPPKFGRQFHALLESAFRLYDDTQADALLLLVESAIDWRRLKELAAPRKLLVAGDRPDDIRGASSELVPAAVLSQSDIPVHDRLTEAVLGFTRDEELAEGARVVAIYSGFEANKIDSVSLIRLSDHLGRLTSRDLQQLETKVPLRTLRAVVDVAIEIGREGREKQKVGTMFVVGDTRSVLKLCQPMGFDPVRGYPFSRRDITRPENRDAIKEIAQLDGAFIISNDGIIRAACQQVAAQVKGLTLTSGLGARHWAGASISQATRAIAVVVSESSGTVRLFQEGQQVLRLEPSLRRVVKWREFDYELPSPPKASDPDL